MRRHPKRTHPKPAGAIAQEGLGILKSACKTCRDWRRYSVLFGDLENVVVLGLLLLDVTISVEKPIFVLLVPLADGLDVGLFCVSLRKLPLLFLRTYWLLGLHCCRCYACLELGVLVSTKADAKTSVEA